MKHNRIMYLLPALFAFMLAACGSSEQAPSAQPTETISVSMGDIYFGESNDNVANPPVWTVSSGASVTLQVTNNGALEHSWLLLEADQAIPVPFDDDEHGDLVLFNSEVITAGETGEFTFAAPAPGEYNIVCSVPGHAGLMQGRLIVSG